LLSKAWILTIVIILISPIFGVYLADLVGFHEPLDIAAEALGLPDWSEDINWTPFFDYTVHGLSAEMGYIVSGIIGVAAILAISVAITRVLKKKEK